MGNGSILTQFTEQDLIDEYQIMVDPVAMTRQYSKHLAPMDLKLTSTRTFKNGVVLLCY